MADLLGPALGITIALISIILPFAIPAAIIYLLWRIYKK